MKMPSSVVSPQELTMLNGAVKKNQASGVDTGFKYRHAYMLMVAVLVTARAIFFPEIVARQLNLINSMDDISGYVQMPGLIVTTFLLRAGVVYCLFINSVRDNRAPAMPRHIFS